MKTYAGARTIDGIRVTVDHQPLDEHYGIRRFTTMGFEWTYEGGPPRQLALALLADHLGDGERAASICEAFMRTVVAELDNDWTMTAADIDAAVQRISTAERTD